MMPSPRLATDAAIFAWHDEHVTTRCTRCATFLKSSGTSASRQPPDDFSRFCVRCIGTSAADGHTRSLLGRCLTRLALDSGGEPDDAHSTWLRLALAVTARCLEDPAFLACVTALPGATDADDDEGLLDQAVAVEKIVDLAGGRTVPSGLAKHVLMAVELNAFAVDDADGGELGLALFLEGTGFSTCCTPSLTSLLRQCSAKASLDGMIRFRLDATNLSALLRLAADRRAE